VIESIDEKPAVRSRTVRIVFEWKLECSVHKWKFAIDRKNYGDGDDNGERGLGSSRNGAKAKKGHESPTVNGGLRWESCDSLTFKWPTIVNVSLILDRTG
jgi:hypothetical protein